MPVKIRLARRGRRKQPYYHIIVADARAPRDGKFIERIGSYNPMTKPATIELDRERAFEWLMKGAQPTETARSILRFKGVLYKKHLQRGVDKGALSQEEADKLFDGFVEDKETKILARIEQTKEERKNFLKHVSGSVKKKYVEETAATDALTDFQEKPASEEPKVETKAPSAEAQTPESETEATAEVEATTPEAEATTPEAEATTPEEEATTPEEEATTPEAEVTATEAEASAPDAAVPAAKVEAPETEKEATSPEKAEEEAIDAIQVSEDAVSADGDTPAKENTEADNSNAKKD